MFVPRKPFYFYIVFGVRQEPTQVNPLPGAPLKGGLLALPTTNILGWRGLPAANTLAYYKNSQLTAVKKLQHWLLISLIGMKFFMPVIYKFL